MGSSASKPQQEVKTFVPNTPVEFSSSLLAQLDSSLESDYTRQQYAETYIQKRVSAELSKLEKESQLKFDEGLKEALTPKKDTSSVSVAGVSDKIDRITAALDAIEKAKPVKSADLKAAEAKVADCLRDNKGKPLNCWAEAEAFKKLSSAI
ncbi:unnamed protein product [Kuraishia capsulata CBS 1993]|uniref:MICOS complex subunit MIC19 n=1 Tax=Kuraishia capsulata CBS 1993 TaxID=1382522 RepID=W6MVY8_9ASCO|nr:uncharacterized protein KUCA_T00002644001 [Kuraishia capsulata CBS 1993]CDK26670.1 unnamed protein product [Kuraishia capsulata CBS 1993]